MFRASAITLVSAAILLGQAPPTQRDWTQHPAIVQVDTQQDIYAVGDPHADYGRLGAVLVGAKIIATLPAQPEAVNWTAGKALVVFTGDLIDKGTQSLKVIALLRSLQSAAAKAGGQVIITMGNHEAEFLAVPDGEKTSEFAAELKTAGLNPAEVAACQGDLGGFLCELPFAARVNDWFFSHGGNTAGRTLQKLSSDLQAGVNKDGFKTLELVGDNSLLEARLGDAPWFQPNNADARTTLAAYANALGVAHIVQGHQPGHVLFADGVKRKQGEMFQRYGLIFLEDTGMSQGVGDSLGAVLRISGDKNNPSATAICFNQTATVIWDTKGNAALGRIPPCGGN
jgi:hypothetical protein